jgi:hypothetical protein
MRDTQREMSVTNYGDLMIRLFWSPAYQRANDWIRANMTGQWANVLQRRYDIRFCAA